MKYMIAGYLTNKTEDGCHSTVEIPEGVIPVSIVTEKDLDNRVVVWCLEPIIVEEDEEVEVVE